VKAYLAGAGVDTERLESKGFGPDQPIETNRTTAGRERNRRVEFVITSQ
jgi:outer membrane protein OmpA-like peptidoglycan-associated protein